MWVGSDTNTANPRGSLDKALRYGIIGSSDESEDSPRRSYRSSFHSYDASEKHEGVIHRDDIDDPSQRHRSRSNLSDCGDRSAIKYVCITQEEQECSVLRSAPINKP